MYDVSLQLTYNLYEKVESSLHSEADTRDQEEKCLSLMSETKVYDILPSLAVPKKVKYLSYKKMETKLTGYYELPTLELVERLAEENAKGSQVKRKNIGQSCTKSTGLRFEQERAKGNATSNS